MWWNIELLKLTRFRGYIILFEEGARDGKDQAALPGGIQAADCRTGDALAAPRAALLRELHRAQVADRLVGVGGATDAVGHGADAREVAVPGQADSIPGVGGDAANGVGRGERAELVVPDALGDRGVCGCGGLLPHGDENPSRFRYRMSPRFGDTPSEERR
jgi:hypothetical protein